MMSDCKRYGVLVKILCVISAVVLVYEGSINSFNHDNDEKQFENEVQFSIKVNTPSVILESYEKKLCELDKTNIEKLKTFNATVRKMFNGRRVTEYVNDFFHEFIQNPHLSFCKELKRFGGLYSDLCKFTDGQKYICMDEILKDIENDECLIYSFGIDKDWSFEDYMSDLGCKVFAFDCTVDYPPKRGHNIFFEKTCLYFEDNEKDMLKSLSSILSSNGHTQQKISYLKMDIEGHERKGLTYWLKSGALDNVRQIEMEFHLGNDVLKTYDFIRTLKFLYFKANYRLISYEANGCAKNTEEPRNVYFTLAEILLKKIDSDDNCVLDQS